MTLTEKQSHVVAFLKRELEGGSGDPLTIERMAQRLNLTVNAVRDHLKRLEKIGVLTWERRDLQTLRLLAAPKPVHGAGNKVIGSSREHQPTVTIHPRVIEIPENGARLLTGPMVVEVVDALADLDRAAKRVASALSTMPYALDIVQDSIVRALSGGAGIAPMPKHDVDAEPARAPPSKPRAEAKSVRRVRAAPALEHDLPKGADGTTLHFRVVDARRVELSSHSEADAATRACNRNPKASHVERIADGKAMTIPKAKLSAEMRIEERIAWDGDDDEGERAS